MCFLSCYWKTSHVFYIKGSLTLTLCLMIAWFRGAVSRHKAKVLLRETEDSLPAAITAACKCLHWVSQHKTADKALNLEGVKNRFLRQVSQLHLSLICCSGKWKKSVVGKQATMYTDSGAQDTCKGYLYLCWADLSLLSCESIRWCL